MLEAVTLLIFSVGLLVCLILGQPVICAILFGYCVFFGYGLYKKIPAARLLAVSLSGVRSVKNILITFVLIGMLTGVWRACGTIATIICASTGLMSPRLIVLLCFWLCSLISFLTGTAFGSAATMGVICMSIANVMGVPPAFAGGAILSGVFFGDRCSPMSTSTQLVCGLTKTDIYRNIRRMMKTCVIPFVLTSAFYLLLGAFSGTGESASDVIGVFHANYHLGWVTLIPALITVLFSVLKLNVKITMLASILAGGALCVSVQGIPLTELALVCLRGFRAADPALAALADGGGILSMVNVGALVLVSSTYAGLFAETGLLRNAKGLILRLANRINPFGAVMTVAVATSLVCCNQSLAIIMTNQLCDQVMPDRYELASAIENTVVVLAGLVPWSIAGTVPLASVGAPLSSMLLASYLYLIPLCDYLAYCFGRGYAAREGEPTAML